MAQCRKCPHDRRMHSLKGCLYQFSNGTQCICNVLYMDKAEFTTSERVPMSISDIIGLLNETNLKVAEVDGLMAEVMPMLRGAVEELALAMTNNMVAAGDTEPQSLSSAYALFQQATDNINNALNELDMVQLKLRPAIEHQNTYIGRLVS